MVTEIRTLATSVHGGQDCPGRTMRELSGMIKLFCVLREVLGTWAYTFVKSNQTTELRSVPFNVCNLCQYIIKKYRKHIKHKNACLLHKERRKERKRNRQKGNFFHATRTITSGDYIGPHTFGLQHLPRPNLPRF